MTTYSEAFPLGAPAPKAQVRAWAAGIDAAVETIPATTADLPDSAEKRYVTDAQRSLLATGTIATSYTATTLAQLNGYSGVPTGALGRVTADGDNTGYYQRGASSWTRTGALIEAQFEARIAGLEAWRGDVFDSLRAHLANPLYSIDLAIHGDSIANNVGASDVASGPFLTSGWADRLIRHLGGIIAPNTSPTISSPGTDHDLALYTQQTDVDFSRGDFVVKNFTTGAVLAKNFQPDGYAKTGQQLIIPKGGNNGVEFTYFGGFVYGVFPKQFYTDTSATWQIIVDSVPRGTALAHATTASYGNLIGAGMGLGWHTVRIINTSASADLALECARVQRQLYGRNLAASGTSMLNYLPTAPTWPITRLPATVTHFLDMSGTNERVSHAYNASIPLPDHPIRMEKNSVTVLDWVRTNRPLAKIGLLISNKPTGAGEVFGDPATYCFSMADVARVRLDLSRRYGVALVNAYARSLQWEAAGQTFLADLLHPNNAFHAEIYNMICARIFDGR